MLTKKYDLRFCSFIRFTKWFILIYRKNLMNWNWELEILFTLAKMLWRIHPMVGLKELPGLLVINFDQLSNLIPIWYRRSWFFSATLHVKTYLFFWNDTSYTINSFKNFFYELCSWQYYNLSLITYNVIAYGGVW